MKRLAKPKTLIWPVCDRHGRLVCVPFSIENLHRVARRLHVKKQWFSGPRRFPHYRVPISLMIEVRVRCEVASTRRVVEIIRSTYPRPPVRPLAALGLQRKLSALEAVRHIHQHGLRLRER